MAPANRPPPLHLTYLEDVAREARRSGLFPIVRAAEARASGLPRVGASRKPAQNVVDLAQTPTLAFPDSTLDAIERRGARTRVSGYWLGLTGPMGALPTHLTEFAAFERRYSKTRPFGEFLDLLAGRMLQLFYRAWADSQPAAQADRIEEDRFAFYLSALTGAAEGVGDHAAFPARGRIHYAALFASRRSSGAIGDSLTHLLGVPVEIAEFQPRWREIEREDRSRLGQAYATLGRDALLGGRVRSVSDAFRVRVRAPEIAAYRKLLPNGMSFPLVSEAIDAFAPSHLEWDVALEIAGEKVPAAALDGRASLGWLSWIGRPGGGVRGDAHLGRPSRRSGRHERTN